ncbi:MAG: DegV family protein, partial [Actinomycetota bacterium]|nr:DegV family protein [Actinomycetota bacterium]
MTGPAVVVVTDSSACLPVEMRDRWGIRVVPLHILLDGADLRDGIDDVPEDIYARDGVSTAGTNPEELTDAYRAALADSGGAGVVAVHISAALSGTFGAAEHVAAQFSGVRVIDS